MPRFFYVYVPKKSRENFEIGKARDIWGWRESALEDGGHDPRTNREIAQEMRPGDYLVFGYAGPRTRVEPGAYADAVLREVLFSRIKRPLYWADTKVWPDEDEIFPFRVGLEVLDSEEGVSGRWLGARAMEALRLSANKRCVPVEGGAFPIESLFSGEARTAAESDSLLDAEGDLDLVALVARRKEQAKIRRKKFGPPPRPPITCDLCGRTLPAYLVHAAHIKRRADASYAERLNLANIMAACVLGCDALFEHGYIHVDEAGFIRATGVDRDNGVLAPPIGERCRAFNADSRPFFAAHAARALSRPPTHIDVMWSQIEMRVGAAVINHLPGPASRNS